MLKPKSKPYRFWASLSDEALLNVELTTDDPERLSDIVRQLPAGDEEPYVEYKYDLRGSGREELRCLHCHQPHLAGFVMRKGTHRFFVGHICGNHIYGENFDEYTADFDQARSRQNTLRRVREVQDAVQPFLAWIETLLTSTLFQHYDRVRQQIADHMPILWEQLSILSGPGGAAHISATLPQYLFDEDTDPEADLQKIAAELGSVALMLVGKTGQEMNVVGTLSRLRILTRQVERVLEQLKELVDFFQPSVLVPVCEWATLHDKKRQYEAGLMSLTCRRDKGKFTVTMPRNYNVPGRSRIETFRAAVGELGGSKPAIQRGVSA